MLSSSTYEQLTNIAWEAARGIVGADVAVRGGELHDQLTNGLVAACEEAYRAGLAATMIQLSIDPELAKVVG